LIAAKKLRLKTITLSNVALTSRARLRYQQLKIPAADFYEMENHSFSTLVVHADQNREANFGAVSVPIYSSSVFAFNDVEEGIAIHNHEKPGYYYGRLGNPTVEALETAMARLESAESAAAFASGMAAISGTILAFVGKGEQVVAPKSMYSTTTNLLKFLSNKFGIDVVFRDAANTVEFTSAITDTTRLIWLETPSNPLLAISDIRAISEAARRTGTILVVDNTFATPFNQRPLELGADAVIHSATKYLGGHSDLTAGILAGRSDLVSRVRETTFRYFGGNLAPQVAWLALRGIKTLALRMDRHNSNAAAMADLLSKHPWVKAVYYPGLLNHPNHEIASKQMKGFGGMLSFDVGTAKAAKDFLGRLKLCTLATSLGGIETILQPVALMTHATLSAAERAAAGIGDGLIRMSVGIEYIDDIRKDVFDALDFLSSEN